MHHFIEGSTLTTIYIILTCCYYSDYLHESIVPTDHFQKSLPRLPVPKLETTCNRYLESQRAFLSDDAYAQTKGYTDEFQNGVGKGEHLYK